MKTDQSWKQREGQLVDGKFRLIQYVGGSDHAGVFRTERGQAEKAAIKVIPAGAINADAQLTRWKVAASLSHPHLLRLFEFGKCQLGGKPFLYVVTELADEDLSQVIPLRALNPGEALPVLVALADVLEYLHGKRFLHGRLKPANIMAVGEKLKISSETICEVSNCPVSGARDAYTAPEYGPGMTSAVDIWSLGMTLSEVLTQKLPAVKDGSDPAVPATLPQPFFDVVRHSVRRDPKQRWTAEEIRTRLNSSATPPVSAKVSETTTPESEPEPMHSRPRYLVPVLAIAALVIILLVLAFRHHPAPESASTPAPANTEVQPSATPAPPKPSPSRNAADSLATSERVAQPGSGRIVTRVMPAVAPSAMRTISGHFRITVRAKVDGAGNVSEANFVSRGPSQYFARLSMDAAKQWKFAPAMVNGQAAPSEWLIQFRFSRTGINDSAEERSP